MSLVGSPLSVVRPTGPEHEDRDTVRRRLIRVELPWVVSLDLDRLVKGGTSCPYPLYPKPHPEEVWDDRKVRPVLQ